MMARIFHDITFAPTEDSSAERYPLKDPARYTEFERKYPPDR